MKELKDFLKELDKLSEPYPGDGDIIFIEDAKRIVSEAYIAGMNFQASQVKGGSSRK